MSEDKKLCWFCEHFKFYPSTPDWSEETPGSDACFECKKHHQLEMGNDLSIADECQDFNWHQSIKSRFNQPKDTPK